MFVLILYQMQPVSENRTEEVPVGRLQIGNETVADSIQVQLEQQKIFSSVEKREM